MTIALRGDTILEQLRDVTNGTTATNHAIAKSSHFMAKKASKKKVARENFRDAKTGEFTTEAYSKKHPDTTVAETLRPRKRSAAKKKKKK